MTTENVFKFVSLRPAQRTTGDSVKLKFARYGGGEKSPLHQRIDALTGDNRREQANELALQFIASDGYLSEKHPVVDAAERATEAETVGEARQVADKRIGSRRSLRLSPERRRYDSA